MTKLLSLLTVLCIMTAVCPTVSAPALRPMPEGFERVAVRDAGGMIVEVWREVSS